MRGDADDQLDFGWFSPPDFHYLLSTIAQHPDPSSFVVVGGQSVVAWALALGIPIDGPSAATPVTQDFDFQTPLAHAKWLADELGADFYPADSGDPTINAGKLVLLNHDKSQKLTIDVLKYVHGLPPAMQIQDVAAQLQFGDYPPVWVLHPLYVLKSRLANLHGIPEKRTPNGFAQARIAVQIAERYLKQSDPAKSIKEVKFLTQMSGDPEAVFCFVNYGIDPLAPIAEWFQSVPSHRERLWPSYMKRVEHKREVAISARDNTIHLPREERLQIRKDSPSTASTRSIKP